MEVDEEWQTVAKVCRAIRDQRRKQELSQVRLAEYARMIRTRPRPIEDLESYPTLYSVLKIAKALDVELTESLKEAGH